MDPLFRLQDLAANFLEEEWVRSIQMLQDDIPNPALDGFFEQASQSLGQQGSNPAPFFDNDMLGDMLTPEAGTLLPGQNSRFVLPIDNERLRGNIATTNSTTSGSFPDEFSASWPSQSAVDGTDFDERDYPAWTALPLNQLIDCQSTTSNFQRGHFLVHRKQNEQTAGLFQNALPCMNLSYRDVRVPNLLLQSNWENELPANALLTLESQNSHKRDAIATSIQTLQTSATDPSYSGVGFFQQDLSQTQVSAPSTTKAPAIVADPSQITEPMFMRATDSINGQRVKEAKSSMRKLKEPSPSDWSMLRPIVHSLYTKHTLSKVRELLRIEYGFKTSEKMLKDRCKKWDQKKYLTSEEKAAVLRRLAIRNSKRSEIRVRGKHIPMTEIERYRKRNCLSLHLELSRLRSSTPPSIRVEVYTPPPPSAISTPNNLRLPKAIMRHMRDYILRSFEAKIWVSQGDTQGIWSQSASIIVSNVNYAFFAALELCKDSCFQEAEYLLVHASTEFQKILLHNRQTTLAVPDLFLQIRRYVQYGKLETISHAIGNFLEILSSHAGPQHPIALTFACAQMYLQMREVNALLEGTQIMMESSVDSLVQALGPLHMVAVGYRLDYISQLILPNDYACGLSALRDLARTCRDAHCGPNDLRSPEVDLALLKALNLRANASYREKLDLAAKILRETEQHGFPPQWIAYYQGRVHSQLFYFWTDQKQFTIAEIHMREAIRISSMAFGFRSIRTLYLQAKFERWLRLSGRVKEALEVSQQRQAASGPLSEAGWSSIYRNATRDDIVQDALETFIMTLSAGVGILVPQSQVLLAYFTLTLLGTSTALTRSVNLKHWLDSRI